MRIRTLIAVTLLALLVASVVWAGKPCTTCTDRAATIVTGTLTSATNGTASPFLGSFNLELSGTWVGTVQLERSFDGGTTYVAVGKDTSGSAAAYTGNVSIVVVETEPGALYRVRCTSFTSGTVAYRLSAGPRLT